MTKPQDDGGPAFPIPGMSPVGTGDPRDGMAGGCDPQPGMSLRDWFAGMFIQGGDPMEFDIRDRHVVAKYAYMMADAMLAARKEGA